MKCPNCDNDEQFITEKSPFGQTECCKCKYKAPHKEFDVDVIDKLNSKHIYKTVAGLHIKSKRTDDYIILGTLNDKITIDGELKYVNSIELNVEEIDALIHELVEMRKQIK